MLYSRSKYLVIFFLLVAVAYLLLLFPGSYSVDSLVQYEQALNNAYHDWHSPVLPFLWKILIALTGKYYSIYLLQMFLYWLFFYLLLFKIATNNVVIIIGTVVAAFSVFIPQYVMKDAHMVISWSMAFIIAIFLYKNKYSAMPRYILMCAAFVFIMYGTSLRLPNILASFFLFYMVLDAAFSPGRALIRKTAITALLCIVTVIGTNLFIYKILNAEKRYPEYKLMLLDIIGITKQTGKNYIPAIIKNANFDSTKLMEMYTPASVDHIYWPIDGAAPMILEPNKQLKDTMGKYWATAVKENPVAYLQNRWQGYLYFLRIKERFANGEYWDASIDIAPNQHNIERRSKISPYGPFQLHGYLHNSTNFYASWLWLLINTIIFVYCCLFYNSTKYTGYKLQAFLQLSAIVLSLSMLLVYQHDRDFRYSYWNYLAAFIGMLHCASLPKKLKGGRHPS